ncbi:MAG: hypothetical protein JW900_04335 [Anaerolineae bacterium]|nr:hypothetical protein [Anaerolineae bacterium]
MIDDVTQARALIARMEAHLPIPARPTSGLVRLLKKQGLNLSRHRELSIRRLFYLGDEGGISCDITPPGMEKMPVICSITHLRIAPAHPLAKEIRGYQSARANRLAREQAGRS